MDGASNDISVAEGLLRALKRRGIDYVLANAGTDFAPVIEGLVRARRPQRRDPALHHRAAREPRDGDGARLLPSRRASRPASWFT